MTDRFGPRDPIAWLNPVTAAICAAIASATHDGRWAIIAAAIFLVFVGLLLGELTRATSGHPLEACCELSKAAATERNASLARGLFFRHYSFGHSAEPRRRWPSEDELARMLEPDWPLDLDWEGRPVRGAAILTVPGPRRSSSAPSSQVPREAGRA